MFSTPIQKPGSAPSAVQTAREAFFQPKLTINAPGDQYEQEADAMAERVVQAPQGTGAVSAADAVGTVQRQVEDREEEPVQRKCSDCEKEEKERVQRQEKEPEEEPVQRKCSECEKEEKERVQRQEKEPEEEPVQRQPEKEEEKPPVQMMPLMRKSVGGGYTATPALSNRLSATKGGGSVLPAPTRAHMESAFGVDFSRVRIHTDRDAAEMNAGISARAFTHGSDIYFNKGQYAPESGEGKRLLAHELTHVVQQGGGGESIINRQNSRVKVVPDPYAGTVSVPGKDIQQRADDLWAILNTLNLEIKQKVSDWRVELFAFSIAYTEAYEYHKDTIEDQERSDYLKSQIAFAIFSSMAIGSIASLSTAIQATVNWAKRHQYSINGFEDGFQQMTGVTLGNAFQPPNNPKIPTSPLLFSQKIMEAFDRFSNAQTRNIFKKVKWALEVKVKPHDYDFLHSFDPIEYKDSLKSWKKSVTFFSNPPKVDQAAFSEALERKMWAYWIEDNVKRKVYYAVFPTVTWSRPGNEIEKRLIKIGILKRRLDSDDDVKNLVVWATREKRKKGPVFRY